MNARRSYPPATPWTVGDLIGASLAASFMLAAATLLCWLTAPKIAPEIADAAMPPARAGEPHYCFRADPPPCLTTVKPEAAR
ncbi:hypothetical protein [Novosphingobium sp. FKTRR1]|uniref:hypothetical protein n=1 Tax=Novosphingobium sp. FKTRR1 TaxID=2879118 RepID=UPI001CF06A29|nr:hypothetical protein [Novosphingobium sp. FKTRR1]